LRPQRKSVEDDGRQQLARLRGGRHEVESSKQGTGTPFELFVCVFGIYFCYLYYGVLQEDLMTSKYGADGKSFKEVCSLLFVVAVQCAIGALFSRVSCGFSPQPATGWQSMEDFKGFSGRLWPMYMQVGFCYVLAMLFSNAALFYISYPTQVIVKSCKMIPVMAVNVLWRGKSYPLAAYVRVLMVTIGIICFTFFKKSAKAIKTAQTSAVGLALALLSLVMDGFVSPTQEEIFSKYFSSTHQMMYYTNLWAMVLLLLTMLVTGDGSKAVKYVVQHPQVLSKIIQFGLMSATGQFFIFFLVRSFSALTLVTVTTTRKFFTVLASVFWFKHKLELGQWLSVAVVFAGLGWEEANKYIQKQRARLAAQAPPPAPPQESLPNSTAAEEQPAAEAAQSAEGVEAREEAAGQEEEAKTSDGAKSEEGAEAS